jgi:hypothetical protein
MIELARDSKLDSNGVALRDRGSTELTQENKAKPAKG